MAKYGDEFLKCPIFTAQSLLGGKWKVIILWLLRDGEKRFSELQKTIPTVTQAMLTNTLRDLESDGLIHREIYRQVPPKVEYSLTPIGQKLLPVLQILGEWGEDYIGHIENLTGESQ